MVDTVAVIVQPIMNASFAGTLRLDIQDFSQAVAHCAASDGLQRQFSLSNWNILEAHMQPSALNDDQVLMEQDAHNRTLYFIESGVLSVHHEDDKARVHMVVVGADSVLEEGAFFSHQPRSATAQASGPCKLWCLTPLRFIKLGNWHSPVALELTMARRLYSCSKRVAVT